MRQEKGYQLPEHPVNPKQILVKSALEEAEELGVELHGFWLHMKHSGRGIGGLDYSPVFVKREQERDVYFWLAITREGDFEERILDPEKTPNGAPIEGIPEFLSQ